MGECWLCTYNHTPDAKTLAAYIAENSGVMGPAQVAAQVSIDIQKRFPDCHGTDADDELEQNLRRFDEEGNVTLDPKLIETYLKVQARIMAIYAQSETSRMFGGS